MRTPGPAREAVPTHRSRHLRSLRAGRLRQVSRPLLRPSPPLRVLARIQQGTRTSKGDGSRPVARFLPRLSRRLRRSARHPAFTVPRPPPSRPLAIHSCAARTALRSSAGLSADANLQVPYPSLRDPRRIVSRSRRRHHAAGSQATPSTSWRSARRLTP